MATFYGVWVGKKPGIYETWGECQEQVNKFPGAKFRKLKASTKDAAQVEWQSEVVSNSSNTSGPVKSSSQPLENILTVDGASNGLNCEFQAVWYPSKEVAFTSKVFDGGTNNIAEFLGLVLAIKHLNDKGLPLRVYTDSVTAMSWVRNKKANTTARTTGKLTAELDNLLTKAEAYLVKNSDVIQKTQILKWETQDWGEIPADFGRK